MIDRFIFLTILASWLVNVTHATLVYQMRDLYDGTLHKVTLEEECGYHEPFDSKRRDCILYEPVLQPFIDAGGHGVFMAIERAATSGRFHDLCGMQAVVCSAKKESYDYDDDCTEVFGNCRSALRHLHEMMFNKPPSKQICNNFARKSIRGFFHDFMSNGIDGSIIGEHDVSMNFGLCRWAQYINVLSDQTSCDPGSIIAMAGQMGYLACGVDLWNTDIAVKPKVTINRPFSCSSNIDQSPLFDSSTKQRKEEFSDAQLASNATAMEEFWYAANGHFNGRGDGEIEYSAEATAAAHAVGRVTCPADGITDTGNPASYKTGFFHKPRDLGNNQLWWAAPSTQDVNREYQQGIDRISNAQCAYSHSGDEIPQPEGIRPETDPGETDFNSEGGFCGMPTQFLGTVRVGGLHRVPRWMDSVEHSALSWPDWSIYQTQCRDIHRMYIPLELLTISDIKLPQSESLTRFLNIAWDGYNSIDSEWDSCVVGCAVPLLENHLCGGVNGLSDYDWTQGYCHNGITDADETVCCQDDCSECVVGPSEGVCMIDEAGPECISALDVGCVIPRKGDGSVCIDDIDCKSSVCKGKCCNEGGVGAECIECGPFGGHCTACDEGFKLVGTSCIDECSCSEGCIDCECGTCLECNSSTHFLTDDSKCQLKRLDGMVCNSSIECVSGGCLGGYCCNESVIDVCNECNRRGKCALCKGDYTLCGHHEEDQGFCKLTISTDVTTFRCGTGGEDTDYPSSDGYDYCGMAGHCPCARAGCYFECEIEQTCWIGSIADSLTNYEPIFKSMSSSPTKNPVNVPTSSPTKNPVNVPTFSPIKNPADVPTISPITDGCEVRNSQGYCDSCKAGFTLCGHHENDLGFCKATISEKYTIFRCGTGGEDTDYPSTDGYNYCGMDTFCPCARIGCYYECEIEETCWIGSIADSLTDYEPTFISDIEMCREEATIKYEKRMTNASRKFKKKKRECNEKPDSIIKKCKRNARKQFKKREKTAKKKLAQDMENCN